MTGFKWHPAKLSAKQLRALPFGTVVASERGEFHYMLVGTGGVFLTAMSLDKGYLQPINPEEARLWLAK